MSVRRSEGVYIGDYRNHERYCSQSSAKTKNGTGRVLLKCISFE